MARILLVEDSLVQRRAIESLLESAGHRVVGVADGQAAWESLQHERPCLMVTDLEMPRMDGLSLLRRIRAEGWRLPVVVMTAHGSEQIAAEALLAGATSYVPKAQLTSELPETIDELLSYVAGESGYGRLMGHVRKAQFEFELDNDPALIAPLVDLLQQMIGSICHFARHERLQLGVAFGQALQNALLHGNLELPGPGLDNGGRLLNDGNSIDQIDRDDLDRRRFMPPYSERKTYLLATIQPSQVTLYVRDDGPGFDYQRAMADVTSAESTLHPGKQPGRGLVLMRAFVDELQFLGKGNEVTLTKRCLGRTENNQEVKGIATSALETRTTDRRTKSARERSTSPVLATLRAVGGSESWTLTTRRATIGRDASCDVVVPHMDVSAHHCQLFLHEGWWFVTDLRTKNGIRVNGVRCTMRHLGPQDTLWVARHKLVIDYDPGALGAVGPTPPPDPF